jgi:acyl CoA:acetate/3-ketoacid CoA transferase alpha subunit
MIGGLCGSGAPIELIQALIDRHVATGHPTYLTVVNNNTGNGGLPANHLWTPRETQVVFGGVGTLSDAAICPAPDAAP